MSQQIMPVVSIVVEDDDLGNQITYPLYSWNPLAINEHVIMRSIKIADTDTVIELAFDSAIGNAAPKSLHKLSDNSNYSVTSGKTAKIVIIVRENTDTSAIELREDASADAGTGTIKHTTAVMATGGFATIVVDPIAATTFVTLEPTTAGDTCTIISAVAIES